MWLLLLGLRLSAPEGFPRYGTHPFHHGQLLLVHRKVRTHSLAPSCRLLQAFVAIVYACDKGEDGILVCQLLHEWMDCFQVFEYNVYFSNKNGISSHFGIPPPPQGPFLYYSHNLLMGM